MPGFNSCCFFKSVKTGSYLCGIYTLILYTILFIVGTFHAITISDTPSLLGFCLMMVILSATSAICSVVMLVGLYYDNRLMLLPWTVAISMTTLIDVMISFYLIKNAISDPFLAVLFVTDVLITALNVYAILCVLSQYREYKTANIGERAIELRQQVNVQQQTNPQRTHQTSSITDDVTSSNAFLLVPTSSPHKGGVTSGSPIHAGGAKMVHCELTTISEEKVIPMSTSSNKSPSPKNMPQFDGSFAETSFQNLVSAEERTVCN